MASEAATDNTCNLANGVVFSTDGTIDKVIKAPAKADETPVAEDTKDVEAPGVEDLPAEEATEPQAEKAKDHSPAPVAEAASDTPDSTAITTLVQKS